MKNFVYIGPSWAARSYDTVHGDESDYTNLAQEWNLPHINLSRPGSSCLENIKKIKEAVKDVTTPIIWVQCEILHEEDLPTLTGISRTDWLTSANWNEYRVTANQKILEELNALGNPIGLIGAHSDIFDVLEKFTNLTVIHPSWQQWIGNYLSLPIASGVGADVYHAIIKANRDTKPNLDLVFLVYDTLNTWQSWEAAGMFTWCHPNRRATELFAQDIKPAVTGWLNNLN